MKVIIDIDEDMYKACQRAVNNPKMTVDEVDVAIANGTPLPKGHGRLIDADEIQFENVEFDTYSDYSRAFDAIDYAPTIIEADKEADNE